MKPVPGSAVVAWIVVALLVGGAGGLAFGSTLLAREVAVPSPVRTETETVTRTVASPSPVPETVTLRACMAAQGEHLDGWTYRASERRTLRGFIEGLDSGIDPTFIFAEMEKLKQGAVDRYNAAADRCFNS